MKKMILHIVEAFGGGVFSYLIALANATCDEFDVTIAYTIRPQTPDGFEKYLDPRIKLIEMKEVKREIRLIQDVKGAVEIYKIYKKVKPDFVHLHSSKAGFLGRMVIDCKANHLAYTPHGYAFLKKDDSKTKRNLYRFIEKFAAVKGGEVVAVSHGEYKEALSISKRATYVNNGINISAMKDITIRNPRDIDQTTSLIIGTVGRISYQKGPDIFDYVAQKFMNDRFLWVGDGELYHVLKSSNIAISSWLEPNEAILLLNKVDIFILPSLWEGLPISLLEAMYLKKICIVSNVIGNNDVIIHGENGFIANHKDDYVKIIQEIKNKKWNVYKITEKAHQDVCDKYNVDIMCEEYRKKYRKAGEKKTK